MSTPIQTEAAPIGRLMCQCHRIQHILRDTISRCVGHWIAVGGVLMAGSACNKTSTAPQIIYVPNASRKKPYPHARSFAPATGVELEHFED